MSPSESKLEAKTRQLAIMHDLLKALVIDTRIDPYLRGYVREALKAWDKPDEPDGT